MRIRLPSYYGLCAASGLIINYNVAKKLLYSVNGMTNFKFMLAFIFCLMSLIFSARLMELLQNGIKKKDFIKIHNGGLSSFGIYNFGQYLLFSISYLLRINFCQMIIVCILCTTIQIFFVRIGNYLQGELIGKYINCLQIRYPSQIQQALTEGLLCGCIVWNTYLYYDELNVSRNFTYSYASIRFINEFFREEDKDMPLFYRKYFRKYGIRWAQAQCFIMVIHYNIFSRFVNLLHNQKCI